MKVCIRTCDRPALLERLLLSIREWEPWLLQYEVEVSDGSHEIESRRANSDVIRSFVMSSEAEVKITWQNIFMLPHAPHCMEFFVCPKSDLRGAFSAWQIYNRHRGQEIVLLDDDMVFPLARIAGGAEHAPVPSENWRSDGYIFSGAPGSRIPLLSCFRNRLEFEIDQARLHDCNTLQLCTRGHGTCDDYSWIDVVPDLIRGDPANSTEIYYHLAAPRLLRMGFFTPTWVGKVPEVPVLPPATRNDDTIAAMVSRFGPCLWSTMTIDHRRPEPKSFMRRMVSDAELLNLTLMLHGHKTAVDRESVASVANALWWSKTLGTDEYGDEIEPFDLDNIVRLADWINKVALKKPADRPVFNYEEQKEEVE